MSPKDQWFKSSFSRVLEGPVLEFDRGEWEAFELGVFHGEFSMPA